MVWDQGLKRFKTIYSEPFRPVEDLVLQTRSLAQIEQARRTALLRCIALSFAIGAAALLLTEFFLSDVPPLTRVAGVLGLFLCTGCLFVSYTQWSSLAGPLFLAIGFGWVLFFAQSDRAGLSFRSVLVASAITILILGTGLLLDRPLMWPAILAMTAISLVEVLLLPIKGAVPEFIAYPQLTAAFYLLTLYAFTAVLTWLYVRSTDTAITTIAAAYSHEYELQQRKDTFLHVASHELRTPLMPLILTSHILEKRARVLIGENSELLQLSNEVARHAMRMNDMVDLLLDLTLLDREQFELNVASCDVAEIIRDAVETQKMVSRKPIEVSGIDRPIQAEEDPRRLWQVAINLISNALKHTPPDFPVAVSVWTHRDSAASREMISLEVRDHGPGIQRDDIPYLFKRYYRAATIDQRRNEGLGLGLYICYAIVAAHRGTIQVASTPGEGTTFTVTIPRFVSSVDVSPA